MSTNTYEILKNTYSTKLEKEVNFDTFIESLLQAYISNQSNIDQLFNERMEVDIYQSIKEEKLLQKDDKLYQSLSDLVGNEHLQEINTIIDKLNDNKNELAFTYCKKFYILGLTDADKLKLLSFPPFL